MEWYTTENGQYRIESLSGATFPGALKIYTDVFLQEEPACIGSEVNKNPESIEELETLCADTALDGASLVVIETETRKVAAIAMNKILVAHPLKEIYYDWFSRNCVHKSTRSVMDFAHYVDTRRNLFEIYNVDCAMEILFLATHPSHRNQKLGLHLCKSSIELAKKLQKGPVAQITPQDLGSKFSNMEPSLEANCIPEIVQAVWTATSSQKISKTLNFEVHATVPMKRFVFEGRSYADRLENKDAIVQIAALPLTDVNGC